MPISYSIFPFENELSRSDRHSSYQFKTFTKNLIIGCVDGPVGRLAISKAIDGQHNYGNWWLDSGNGYNFGQVLLGNAATSENMLHAFHPDTHSVDKLPSPLLQCPELGMLQTDITPVLNCAEAVQNNVQSQCINSVMAVLLQEFVRRIFHNELTWMGAYIDMNNGNLKCVDADPNICARIFKVRPGPMICKINEGE
jgi:hypothetical protein